MDETSGDLAIGYKSQGSFLVDFRQVDTTPQTNLGNITYHPNWHSGYDPNPARAGVSSVAPETTFFMEQGNSNFYPTRCQGCYSNWSYYDKNSRWVYGSGFVDDGTYRDVAGNIDDQYHYHSGSNYYGNHFCYDWANGNPRFNTVGSYTYNTGAHLEMVQDISGEGFDAYYVKIKQQALSYLDKVTVKFSDGQQMVIDGNTIRAQYYDSLNRSNNGGVATSVQLDNQGNYFFRLNLMKVVDASGNPVDLAANPKAAYAKHVPSYGKEDAYAYRDTFNDYADGVPTFRVTQIVYDVTINQGTLDSAGYPKVPDYGQWFADSLGASSAEWSKNMSFEVTGRFIRTDQATSATAANTVTSTTTMNMTIGGEYSGEKYVHAAAQRYDSPNQRAVYNGNEHDGATSETLTSRANNASWRGNARNIYRDIATTFSNMGATGAESLNFYYDEYGRGSWSYKNFHRSGQCCHDGWCSYHGCYHHHYHFYQFDEGKMRHLRTSSRMIAYESRNFVQKSVNRDAGSLGWAGNTNVSDNHSDQRIFADDEGYFMSLYRWEPGGNDTNYGDHDYKPWGTNISAADNIRINDSLPTIYPDQDLEYYGYLGMGLKFFRTSKNGTATADSSIASMTASNVWAHLNPVTNYARAERADNFDKVFITLRTTAWDKVTDGSYTPPKTQAESLASTDNGWRKRAGSTYEFTTSDGQKVTHTVNRTIRIREYNMYLVNADGTETMIDEDLNPITGANAGKHEEVDEPASPGLTYLFTKGLNKDGDALIYFKRPSDYTPDFMGAINWSSAPEYSYEKKPKDAAGKVVASKITKTGDFPDHQPLTINLPDGEFVTSYTLDLGPYGGDADATAETARAYDGDRGSGQTTSDYEVLGRPYIYKGQNNKLYAAGTTAQETRFQNYIDNAISTAHVDYNRYYAPTTFLTSAEKQLYSYNNWSIVNSYERQFGYPGSGYRWVPRNSAFDTAWMVGYKVRYGYAAGIQTENNGALTDNAENYYENNSSAHGVIKDRAQDQVVTRTTSYGYNAGYENITPQGAWANNGTYDVTRYTDYWGNTTTANVIRWNTDTKRIYDYGDKRTLSWVDGKQQIDDTSDNLTPTKATFEVRFQNQFDGTVGNDVNNNRAAHLTRISLKSTFDENLATNKKAFRLQSVYVPAYLVRNGENAKTDHVHCDDHVTGTCISYQYTPFVKIGDEYIKYTGPRALDGDNKIVTKPGSVQTITGELKTEGDKVTDTRECSSVTDARQIYLTITGDVYTKDDNAYIEATACGGQENKDCSCVECDGGWFNATNFRFKYVDADGAEKEVNVTFDELKAAGRVSGPWKIDEGEAASGPSGTARIVYDENGNPTFDADGDYVIDFESFFRAYVASSADDESGEGADAASAGNADGKNIISYSTYNGVSATNTIAGFAGDAKMDQTYAKALFTELEITFEAPTPTVVSRTRRSTPASGSPARARTTWAPPRRPLRSRTPW